MKILNTDNWFPFYDIYLGEKIFDKGAVIEASEEDGYIIYTPKQTSSNWMWIGGGGGAQSTQPPPKPKKEFGKVYIVRSC